MAGSTRARRLALGQAADGSTAASEPRHDDQRAGSHADSDAARHASSDRDGTERGLGGRAGQRPRARTRRACYHSEMSSSSEVFSMIRSFTARRCSRLPSLGLAAVAGRRSGAEARRPQGRRCPALDAMHEVIMPLWHDAWPNKDVKAHGGDACPTSRSTSRPSTRPSCPGVLRDKQAAWMAGVRRSRGRPSPRTRPRSTPADNEALLKAAEKLHTQYEGLVKVVRPS